MDVPETGNVAVEGVLFVEAKEVDVPETGNAAEVDVPETANAAEVVISAA